MKIRAFRKQLADLHNHSSALEPPKPAPCCSEGGLAGSRYADKTQDVAIHIGGHHDQLGPIVPRRFPLVLAGENQPPIAEGSGRRELAAWISSPENPLVARVMVNRLWLHHFGQGLVRTPDNFGRYGQRPTHPELLDYLALRLIEHGWSLKRLHREMVLSATYRQSSAASVATLEKDPENLLLGRANRLRLDAEQLRDSLLLVAGQLDRTPSGRPFPELATPRRTVYWQTPRVSAFNVATDPYRSIFDGANASIMVHQRNVSTTPLQALFLLNHPFASEQSRHLAIRVLKEQETDYQRIQWVYQLLYNRPAEPQELALGRKFLAQETGQEPEERSWQRYCQVLLCANEFVYLD